MELNYEKLRGILQNIPANVFFKDDECRYQLASHVCEMLNTGGRKDFTIMGKTDLEIQPDRSLGEQYYTEDCELIKHGGQKDYISEMVFPSGTYYYRIQKIAVADSDGRIFGIVGLITDMTKEITLQKKLEYLSITDTMTGVYNRTYYEIFMASPLESRSLPLSLMSLDFDRLKRINDNFGHALGDQYIKIGVETIKNNIPKSALLYRTGGDEFFIQLPHCHGDQCEQIAASIKKDFSLANIGKDVRPSMSIGFITIEDPEISLEAAVREADQRMYLDKHENHEERP